MKRVFRTYGASAAILILAAGLQAQTSPTPGLKEILEKNILASGGKEALSRVECLSFRAGPARYYVHSNGLMKIVLGKDPVITEAVLIGPAKAQRNSYNTTSELTGQQKAVNQCLSRLFSGLFTLANFEKQLQFQGLKSYGPEKLYHLSSNLDGVKADFFLRPDEGHLKRLVLQGSTTEGEKYEVNYDFAPFEETEGLIMPLSWFTSMIGSRGILYEVTELKVNPPLEKDFFSRLEVNVGTVEATEGILRGNILDFNTMPNSLMIVTNWTRKDVEKAGFRTNDRLTLTLEGAEAELAFYASPNEAPPMGVLAQGAVIMALNPRAGETYVIQFIATDTSPISPKLKLLAVLEVRKK